MITNDARCSREIKARIAMAKAAFNEKKKTLFTSKLDLELRKKLVKCYIWSIALYGAETWTLRKLDRKYLKVLKCGAGEGLIFNCTVHFLWTTYVLFIVC
jgi:hypothetical protein